jgi:5-methylcytosine-specific restriction endonuclease McrA
MTEAGKAYAKLLTALRGERRRAKARRKLLRSSRGVLSKVDREVILTKTNGRCHICGGEIDGTWQADHVLAHSVGGEHAVDNYLPAHASCNNYRWDYTAAEFQEIFKLGVWSRTQVERGTTIGREIAARFSVYEVNRRKRRKASGG